jgi:hypothetical protein
LRSILRRQPNFWSFIEARSARYHDIPALRPALHREGHPCGGFFPKPQSEFQKMSDEQRFSGLTEITRVHRFENTSTVDWNPGPIDIADLKETISLDFQNLVKTALASTR